MRVIACMLASCFSHPSPHCFVGFLSFGHLIAKKWHKALSPIHPSFFGAWHVSYYTTPSSYLGMATVWGCTSQQNLTRLQRLQNRAMRVILNAPPRSHIEDLLSELRWMSVRQRLEYSKLVLMWKIFHGHSPPYLCDKPVLVSDIHEHRTTSTTKGNTYIQ